MAAAPRCSLLGCGILAAEVHYLIERNGWPVDTDFLPSSLHIDLEKLEAALTDNLARHPEPAKLVFYGCCHPRMDALLDAAHTFRTEGQNCVAMLLGHQRFMDELSAGAFFLLEDWALHWDDAMRATFGDHPEATREIFQLSNRYILALRTPCSGDFSAQARHAAESVGLPLRWLDVGLESLEQVLAEALARCQQHTGPEKSPVRRTI